VSLDPQDAEECARQAPEWLRQSWESSKQASLDRLSMDEIDAQIAAARKARREPRLKPRS